jgi:two-component system NarL family response regulator
MDIDMPTMNGLEATRTLKEEFPDTQIVMLTISEDDAHLFEAIKSGAAGYLLKSLDADELCALLLGVMQGEAALSPGMAGRVLNEFAREAASPALAERVQQLTKQEIEVLTMVAQGQTYKEIGAELGFSERTIKRYMGEIIQRLQLKNRAEAIEFARRIGLPSPPLPGNK